MKSSRLSFVLAAVLGVPPFLAAAEKADRELIEALQQQVKAVMDRHESAVAGIVVSRSELYPNKPTSTESPGKLGGFDRAAFLQESPLSDKAELVRRLDLSDRASVPDNSYGGGVVLDATGLVLTTYHVIDGATKIYVRLPDGKGSYADIHAADARCDLAVLKLITPPPGLKAVPVAEVRTAAVPGKPATISRGNFVVLLANTFDSTLAERPTGAMGLIAGVRERPSTRLAEDAQSRLWSVYQYGTLLQYVNQFPLARPSKLNLGMSGAALLNLDGELVGLTTTASPLAGGEDAAGFALPMDEAARRALAILKRGEEVEYGFLGVTSSEHALGLSILVSPHGPADVARLQDRDVIRKVNGHPIESHKDLFLHIGSALAGGKAKVTVQRLVERVEGTRLSRASAEIDLDVVLGKYQHGLPFIASARPEPVFGLRVDHGSVLLQQLLGNDFAIQVPPGVSVRELVPDSPAAAKFKALNDAGGRWIITQVNGTPTTTPAEFYAAAKGRPAVTLTLIDPTVSTPRTRELTLP